jgi:PST family polysaccharide transporter
VIAKNERAPGPEKNLAIGDVEHLRRDLAGKSVRGGVSLVVSEIGCNIFRLLGTVVLARLLTPEHFGLIGMVTALTACAEMFKDLGLGMATVQQKEISHEQISTLFWINTGVGALFMLVVAGAAPFISWFYADSRLLWVAITISSTFFFGGFTVQHQALLRREMHFAKLALIQVLSTGLSTVIGILLAWQGFEYWALVWKEVSRAVIQASATWMLSHWLPGLPRRGSGVRTMFHTGSHVTGFNILAFTSGSLDQVLLGKFWGAGPVGLYKQAVQLLMLPASLVGYPITYVMVPALSALQSEPERYRSYYGRVLSFLAFSYMPFIAYIAVYSESLISLVLGDKWMASSSVLQILALGAIVGPITNTCGIVMVTNGRTKDYLRLGVAQAIFLTIAVCIGINWGLIGVAWAYVGYTYAFLLPLAWFSFKDTPISVGLFFEVISLPALASIVMSILLVIIRYVLEAPGAVAEIGYSLFLAPLLYCGVWMLLPRGKLKLVKYFSDFRLILDELIKRVWSLASPAASGS